MNTNTIAGPHHGPSRHRAGRTAASAVGPHIPTAASGEPQRSTGLRDAFTAARAFPFPNGG